MMSDDYCGMVGTLWQVARMVTKHFQDLHQRELRAEREDVQKMKRIASSVAKMVREFWSNIEKVRIHVAGRWYCVYCILMMGADVIHY